MDFAEVLRTAWKIIWKHKILWIFGIFAGCSRGGGGGGGNSGWNRPINQQGNPEFPYQQLINQASRWIADHWWVVVLFVIVILLLILLSILLSTMGRIGLIRGTVRADAGAEHLGFMELWDESRPYFWRVFLLMLLVFFATLIVAVPLALLGAVFVGITFGVGLLCLLPLVCIMVLALWALGIVVQQAETAIVVENLGVMDGLRRGWEVFRQNIGPMLIMWLILLVIGFIIGLLIALPVLVIVVPAAIAFALANSQTTGVVTPPALPLALAAICFCVYLPVALVLNGILMAYLQSAWTLTYLRLTHKPQASAVTALESPAAPAPNA